MCVEYDFQCDMLSFGMILCEIVMKKLPLHSVNWKMIHDQVALVGEFSLSFQMISFQNDECIQN